MKRLCPVCSKDIMANKIEKNLAPFCSKRCKMIDLGKWLGEKYIVAKKIIKE